MQLVRNEKEDALPELAITRSETAGRSTADTLFLSYTALLRSHWSLETPMLRDWPLVNKSMPSEMASQSSLSAADWLLDPLGFESLRRPWRRHIKDSPNPFDPTLDRLRADEFGLRVGVSEASTIWRYVESKFSKLAQLPENWDDEGAPPPSKAAANRLRRLLRVTLTEGSVYPVIAPDFDGGLSAEWLAGKQRVAIDIDCDGMAYVYASDSFGNTVISAALSFGEEQYQTLRSLREVLARLSARIERVNPGWRGSFH
jgi:hypothetical protein